MSESLVGEDIVLLTGATGYIGSVVAETLLAHGWKVRGMTRRPDKASELSGKGIAPIVGDVNSNDTLRDACEGVKGIIHTAGPSGPVPGKSMEEVVGEAATVLDTLAEVTRETSQRLISMSGVSIYGDANGRLLDESSPEQAPPFATPWVEAERRLVVQSNAHILRSSIVYGRGGSKAIVQTRNSVGARGSAGVVDAKNHLSVVHVDDLAMLVYLMLTHKSPPSLVNGVTERPQSGSIMSALGDSAGVGPDLDRLGPEEAAGLGGIGIYLPIDMNVSGDLARTRLGWEPAGPSLVEELRSGSLKG